MASTPKLYRRLPGTGYRRIVSGWIIFLLFFVLGIFALLFRGRRIQLWQGDEHLLLVEWDGYREYYKRFGYRDIQAFVVWKTIEDKIVSGILLVILSFFALIGVTVEETGVRIFFLCIAGFFGLFLLINLLYGPTCRCYLRTAVQIEELPSLNRLRRARKVIRRLEPLIAGAQGQLAPEEVAARMRALAESAATAATAQYSSAAQTLVSDDPNAPPRMVA